MDENNTVADDVTATETVANEAQADDTSQPTPDSDTQNQSKDVTREVDPQITKLRKEAEQRRRQLREREKSYEDLRNEFDTFKQSLANTLGVGGEESTPEDLLNEQIKRTEIAEQRYSELLQRTALTSAVVQAKADADIAIPFIKGTAEFAALDPSTDDYEARVVELVAETVEKYPKLRAQVAPATSGNTSNPTTNSNGSRLLTVEDLDDMSAEEIYNARKAGKLDHLFK